MITHKPTKAYTVCFLFSPDMDEVLLQKKTEPILQGCTTVLAENWNQAKNRNNAPSEK